MSQTNSARHGLPFLLTGQAQKELTHNEALIRLEALLHPVVEAERTSPDTGLSMADSGKCWLVADSMPNAAPGDWAGHAREIAYWTGGSWRFVRPVAGMSIWNRQNNSQLHYISGQWTAAPAISNATGGTLIDVEARAVLNMLLQRLRIIGLARM